MYCFIRVVAGLINGINVVEVEGLNVGGGDDGYRRWVWGRGWAGGKTYWRPNHQLVNFDIVKVEVKAPYLITSSSRHGGLHRVPYALQRVWSYSCRSDYDGFSFHFLLLRSWESVVIDSLRNCMRDYVTIFHTFRST